MKQDGAYEHVDNWKGVIRRTYSECENLCENLSDVEKALQKTMIEFENNPSIAEKVVVNFEKHKPGAARKNTVMRKVVKKGQCEYKENFQRNRKPHTEQSVELLICGKYHNTVKCENYLHLIDGENAVFKSGRPVETSVPNVNAEFVPNIAFNHNGKPCFVLEGCFYTQVTPKINTRKNCFF